MFSEDSAQYLDLILKNTAFETIEQARAVVKTLKWLDAGAHHQTDRLPEDQGLVFDMQCYVEYTEYLRDDYKNKDLPSCGTACCIAGAIALFEKPAGNAFDALTRSKEPGLYDKFKLNTNEDLDHLFIHTGLPMSHITPKGAATTLRRYIEKGVVKWHYSEQIKTETTL